MKPLVVMLHGLARGHGSMSALAAHLETEGFEPFGRTYRSRQHSLAELAAGVTEWIVEHAGARPVCAVTHSMGGVLVRHLHDPRIRWHRIVMLAPPNQGSQLAAGLADLALFRWFYGPAGTQLGDGSRWPMPPGEHAVIAGTRSLALTNVSSWTIGRRFPAGTPNDGTVAVSETRLPSMAAFAEVDATHTWIMNAPLVKQLVVRFLRDGTFDS